MTSKFCGKLLVTGFGTGYLPVAPGTWGSLVPVGAFLLTAWLADGQPATVGAVMSGLAVVSSVICVGLGRFTEDVFGRKDPGACVIDEWAGQSIALVALPTGDGATTWLIGAAVGFVAFRVFDILKPPPARQMEKLPGGWGVLLDDVFAGAYVLVVTQLFVRFIW